MQRTPSTAWKYSVRISVCKLAYSATLLPSEILDWFTMSSDQVEYFFVGHNIHFYKFYIRFFMLFEKKSGKSDKNKENKVSNVETK